MQINLYSFSKRLNSTLQPAGDGAAVTVSLKEGTSIYSPSFILNASEAPAVNYLKWADRYYYINDNVYLNKGLYQIDCSMDALATFKTQIQATSAFVLYSSSSYNTDIPDQRLSTKKDETKQRNQVDIFGDKFGGAYIVTYIGKDGGTPRVISINDLPALIAHLSDTSLLNSLLADASNYVSRTLNSANECITGIRYSPIYPASSGSASNIILGSTYDTKISAFPTTHRMTIGTVDVPIPWNFTDFRNRSQYTSMFLFLPGYGKMQLNPDNYQGRTSIPVSAYYDPISGDLTYRIDMETIAVCSIGFPIQFGTSSVGNLMTAVNSGLSLVAGITSGNPALAVMGAFNAVTSSLQANPGSVGVSGGSSALNAMNLIELTCISHDTTIDPASMQVEIGRPLNAVASMGSLSGYVQTVQFSLAAPAPENILQQIDKYMDGGVYLE